MGFYLFVFLCTLLCFALLVYWLFRIVKFYKRNRIKAAVINSILFGTLILIIGWELQLIPLSADWDFRNKTKGLTGKQFWSWNYYRFEDIGIRGEGYTFEIYRLSDEVAKSFVKPNKEFFKCFPSKQFETTNWRETPMVDTSLINFVTPNYASWSKSDQEEVARKQKLVRQIALEKGSYFAIRRLGGTDLYLISPGRKLFVYINHNM